MLDTPDYVVSTSGILRIVASFIAFDSEISNWRVIDKRSEKEFRLTRDEQEILEHLAEHLCALEFAPEFELAKSQRKQRTQALLAKAINAIVSARNGNKRELDQLRSISHIEFIKKFFSLWEPDISAGLYHSSKRSNSLARK